MIILPISCEPRPPISHTLITTSRGQQIASFKVDTRPLPDACSVRIYQVRLGDTLWRIAVNSYGTGHGWWLIKRASHLSSTLIRPGQWLTLPALP